MQGSSVSSQEKKAARKQAEALLESKSRELYENTAQLSKANKKLERLAFRDAVTELPNRNVLEKELEKSLCESGSGSKWQALHLVDLNDYNFVSGALGHSAADLLLQEVASRLSQVVGINDIVARIGGDEFAVLQVDCGSDEASIRQLAHRITDALSQPHVILSSSVYCSASVGVAVLNPFWSGKIDRLFAEAELALSEAKSFNRGSFVVFDDRLKDAETQRLASRQQICTALDANQFEAWLQPQFDLQQGALAGYEALARWRHPDRGVVGPGEFIPILEHMGLATKFGTRMLEHSLCLMERMRQSRIPVVKVGVNLSAAQLIHGDIVDTVTALLRQYSPADCHLEIEITEGALLYDMGRVCSILDELRKVGVSVALDDFGTGYSSLSYLQALPLDRLKIDQAFIRDLLKNNQAQEIVAAIVQMAKALKLETVAEGIETREQATILKSIGVDVGQGYLHSKPLPPSDILKSHRPIVLR